MARPRPEPGRVRAVRGAVEAVEHVREVVGADAGAVIVDLDGRSLDDGFDRCRRRAELQSVVDEVRDRGSSSAGSTVDRRRVLGLEGDLAAGASTMTGHDPVDELSELDLLYGFLAAGIGRELDELGHQVGELAELEVGFGEQRAALGLVEGASPTKEVDVGAERGERGAKLVTRVEDEPLLLLV